MNRNIKISILTLPLRADKNDKEALIETYVDLSTLNISLSSPYNNHILYGRRGTGKTHVLSFLASSKEREGDIPVYIDLRTIGSSASFYNDTNIPLDQRAIRLIIDIIYEFDEILRKRLTAVGEDQTWIDELLTLLSALQESCTRLTVNGEVTEETVNENVGSQSIDVGASLSFTLANVKANSNFKNQDKKSSRRQCKGKEYSSLNFPEIQKIIRSILEFIHPHKIWVILDEFSEIPDDLQPYLADMLRRVFFSLKGAVVKIGAMKHRTNVYQSLEGHGYLGLEIGADITSCDLDNYLVFENNEVNALFFFRTLLYKHINNLLPEEFRYQNSNDLVNEIFASETAFIELVRASEGVPRDAFNILSKAVELNTDGKVSVPNIRAAARRWYVDEKEVSVRRYKETQILLPWIIDCVIYKRHARAFLIRSDINYPLIDYLYDARILHILKQGVSSKDTPGTRYIVYAIDYGTYVELINTIKKPLGLFGVDEEDGSTKYIEVPQTDYRSIRRAILDMDEFKAYYEHMFPKS